MYFVGPYVVSVSTSSDHIIVSWRSLPDHISLPQNFQVRVTPKCPTGIMAAQTQVYTVAPDDTNDLTLESLGDRCTNKQHVQFV